MQALVDTSQPLRSGSMDTSIPALIAIMQRARSISLQFRSGYGSAGKNALVVQWSACEIVRPLESLVEATRRLNGFESLQFHDA